MNLTPTDDQQLLRRTVREFAEAEIRPHVMAWDEAQAFPNELVGKLAAMGLMGIQVSEDEGGSGMSAVDYCIAIEELARVDPSIALSVAAHNGLAVAHLAMVGTAEQKARYLGPLVRGEMLGAWGLTEADSGSDAGAMRTTARSDAGGWVINGTKQFITHGRTAGLLVVMAVTDASQGSHGISAFIVERGTAGLKAGRHENKLGMRASDTSEVILDDVRVPAANVLGAVGRGFVDTLRVLDAGRIGIAALSVGLAQGAFEAALAVRQSKTPVRTADRHLSGHPVEARRHGDADRGRPLAHLPRRMAAGPPRGTHLHGLVGGEALRQRGGSSRRRGMCPDPRRLRLREGLPCREILSRREALHDWRGHERDSAARDCPAASGPVNVSVSLVTGVLEREPRAVARALSAVSDDPVAGPALLAAIRGRTGRALLVGVTGPPGAGKSTLVDRLIRELRGTGRTVGVLAVDPTSPFTGGALLGDRVRMQAHASDSGVFIRSLATRGQLGGLSSATSGAVDVLDAAGFDVVIIETVGVGQDELDIARLADIRLVVFVPDAGDEVQDMKAGLMEIGDIFVVNKSDRAGADRDGGVPRRRAAADRRAGRRLDPSGDRHGRDRWHRCRGCGRGDRPVSR